MQNAWNEAYTLAAQLGYTPERHLVDRVRTQPAHLLLGTAGCEVQVFFATPLNPSNFTSHLKQAISPLRDGSPTNGLNMYVKVPLIVNGGDAIGLYHTSKDELPPVYEHTWLAMDVDGSSKMVILYSELSKAKAEIEYDDRQITENVAYVGVDAGDFPFWIWASRCIGSRR